MPVSERACEPTKFQAGRETPRLSECLKKQRSKERSQILNRSLPVLWLIEEGTTSVCLGFLVGLNGIQKSFRRGRCHKQPVLLLRMCAASSFSASAAISLSSTLSTV